MELSHFVSMVQYEILKSFDFSKYLQDEIETEVDQPIQLAIEVAEVKIPLVFDIGEKTFNVDEISKEIEERNLYTKTHLDMPFSKNISDLKIGKNLPHKMSAKPANLKEVEASAQKVKNPKTPTKVDSNSDNEEMTTGNTIEVQVANPSSKRDEGFDASLIGFIRLVIKPVIK
jgi:hypothetical protein